jgi:hypothetical protein
MAGCDILDVENPNNLIEADLGNAAAADPMANGLEGALTRALSNITAPYSVATDELTWVGSRDAWGQLDAGAIEFAGNEFTNQAFPFVGEARWMSDNFKDRLEAFAAEGSGSPVALARVYLYNAIIYTTIADMFDDFVIGSDRTEPAPPVGDANMVGLYDTALGAVNSGLALNPDDEWRVALLGMKARIIFSKAVWGKVNPVNTSSPLVNAGTAEAAAALLAMGTDYRFEMVADGGFQLQSYMAGQINDRLEFTFDDTWVQRNDAGNKVDHVTYPDMIDGIVHPFLDDFITTFVADQQYANLPIVSSREMHLILAEGALASGDMGGFTTHINLLRALDGLTPFSGQVDARALLEESRAINLYLQGRRLTDLYRFGINDVRWNVNTPGTFLPITKIEIESNPLVDG